MMDEETYISVADARKILGFSKHRMSDYIREGKIETVPDQWDARRKLVRLSDVKRLMRAPRAADPSALAIAS
jgi:hypothetical protein